MAAAARMWPGIHAHVVFANVDSTFDAAQPNVREATGSALSRRAASILHPSGFVVAYEGQCDPPGRTATRAVLVPRGSGDLCADLLDHGPAFDELLDAAEHLPRPWPIWAQVYSPTMDTLSFELLRYGFDRSLLPVCSGVSVGFWNSKRGGGELLQRALGNRHVDQVACPTVAEAARVVAESGNRWVIKPDRAMGGAGVVFIEPPTSAEFISEALTRDADRLRELPQGKAMMKFGKSADWDPAGPFVLQKLIGDPATNRSPSADFWVDGDGAATMVGFAEQRLDEHVRYVGSRSPSSHAGPERAFAHEAGMAIARTLGTEGYRGLFNIDLVVSGDGEIAVVEVNLRQSAPLDQSVTMARRYGPNWERSRRYVAHEPGDAPPEDVASPADEVLRYRDNDGRVALTLAVSGRS